MQSGQLRTSIVTTLFLATAACGGGADYAATTPAPPVTPNPTPATPAAAGPAIPAAAQTSSPGSPIAGTSKFSTLSQVTDFPLLLAAARGGPGDGDPTTTSAG